MDKRHLKKYCMYKGSVSGTRILIMMCYWLVKNHFTLI